MNSNSTNFFQVRVQKFFFFEFEFGKNCRVLRVRVCSPGLCGADGVMYDFFIYNGKIEHLPHEPDLGASSNAVVNLTQTIPSNLNHLFYFDRWFTSIALQAYLASKAIHCLGTVSLNRLPGVGFASDKDFAKTGQGTYQKKCAVIDNVETRAVKWMDSRSVVLLSTFE